MNWEELIKATTDLSSILVTGRRRHGKTALGMFLMALLYRLFKLPCYIVDFPKSKEDILPDFIKNIPLTLDLPEHSIIFIDEAAMKLYARESYKQLNKWISTILGASGQKGQIIIFATHHTRKLEVNVVMEMDIWVLKQPSRWYVRFERKELKPIVSEAFDLFKKIPRASRKSHAVVYEHELGPEIITNPLPSFWTDELSKVFEGISLNKHDDNSTDVKGVPKTKNSKNTTRTKNIREIVKEELASLLDSKITETLNIAIQQALFPGIAGPVKDEYLHIEDGVTIHFKEAVHDKIHNALAELLGTTPDMFYDSSKKSSLKGYDKFYGFDLSRKSEDDEWHMPRVPMGDLFRKINGLKLSKKDYEIIILESEKEDEKVE